MLRQEQLGTRKPWKLYVGGIWTLLPNIAQMYFIVLKIPYKLSKD
jgi:hypothetical protein